MSEFAIAVGADPTDPGSINIHDGTVYAIMDGTLDLSEPGWIRFVLRVRGTDADARIAAASSLFRLIRSAGQAASIGSGITFSMRPHGSAWAHYDLTGAMTDPERNVRLLTSGQVAMYTMELRAEPYTRADPVAVTITGTKAGSTAAFLLSNIPGHIDALAHLELTDTSAAGVINRLRVAVIRGAFAAATDYTPWLDAPAMSGATDTADAASLGGEYAARTLNSTAFANIARAVQPAGTRQRGRMDGYARVWSTGTAIGTPASLTGTVDDPDATTAPSSLQAVDPVTIRQLMAVGDSYLSSTATSDTATLPCSATADGSTIVIAALVRNQTIGSAVAATVDTPAGFTLIATLLLDTYTRAYLFQDINSTAGATSFVLTYRDNGSTGGTTKIDVIGWELAGAGLTVGVRNFAVDNGLTGNPSVTLTGGVEVSGELVLATIFAADYDAVSGNFTWMSGFSASGNRPGLAGGSRANVAPGSDIIASAFASGDDSPYGMMVFSVYPVVTTVAGATTYSEPTPGELEPGTYVARVQAIDAAGYRGNAVVVTGTPTVTVARSSVDYSWPAVTNATAYALTIQFGSRYYEVITTGLSYELETLSGLKEVAALPATSGAVAPAPRIRARVGMLNDHSLTALPEVALSGSGAFEIVRLFSNQQLPPTDAPLEDTWASYAVEVQGRSANGNNAPVRIDALWVVPCDEPQVEAWIQGLAHATKVRHILESHRSGRGTIGWLETIATGVEAGRLTTAGSLLIPAGTSIVLLEFEQAAGVHAFGAQVTVTLTVWPRQKWEAEP